MIALSGLVFAMACSIVAIEGVTEPSVRMLVRASARSSAILCFTSFAAPGVGALRLGAAGDWLNRNASAIFLGFGFSHFVHLVALVLWVSLFPGSFFTHVLPTTVVMGGFFYALIGFMCVRVLLGASGRRGWVGGVEDVGRFMLWAAFAIVYVSHALSGSGALYALLGFMAMASLALRLAPRLVHTRQTPDVV